MVDEFYSVVCTRRKLKVNAGKSKVMVFEKRELKVVDFDTLYRVNVPAVGKREVVPGEKMYEVKEFKYLGTVLCKYGEMEGEIREIAVKGRCVIGPLARIIRGRNVYMEVKRGLRNSIILLPTLIYG